MKPIRILLADDHALVRAGLRALLRELGMEVVAEASNGREALELIGQHIPEVVLMDIAMPELNGLEATARVAQQFPHVRVILLSMHANVEYARRALRAGAAGYLLKNSKAGELEMAIAAVAEGETYLTPAIAKLIAKDYAQSGPGGDQSLAQLSPRQFEILRLIAQGHTRKQISELLDISAKTFDTYRAQIMEHLHVHDAVGLVRVAMQTGLLTPDD